MLGPKDGLVPRKEARLLLVVCALAVVLVSCSSSPKGAPQTTDSPPGYSPVTVTQQQAQGLAADFVAELRVAAATGDYAKVAQRWSGYPYGPDPQVSRLQAFVSSNQWLVKGDVQYQVYDAWSRSPTSASKIVVLASRDMTSATAILVESSGVIQRIQTEDTTGTISLDGLMVKIGMLPSEGGVRAYYDGQPVASDQIKVDSALDLTTINVPGANGAPKGSGLLVVSMATPELPTALAVIVNH